MQEYGFSDINEAKRRVQEMKNRAEKQKGEEKSLSALIASLGSGRDKALAVSLLYLIISDGADEKLISAILNILFN